MLLVARTGRQACPALDELLADWDGQLTVPRRKWVSRHIEQCPVCTVRMRRELRAMMLGSITPVATLALAAAEIPGGIKHRVLSLATGDASDAVEHRSAVGRRAGPFGPRGFPKPLDPPTLRWRSRAVRVGAAAGAAAVAAVVLAVALDGGTHDSGAPPAAAPPGVSGGVGGGRGAGRHARSAHHGPTTIAVGTSSPSPTAGTPASPTTRPSQATSPSDPVPSTPGSPPARHGTLSVSPTTIALAPLSGTTITLTARNGPVHWAISEPSSLLGELAVSPSSGTLASGKSTKVTVTGSIASLDTHLTANPGNVTITVIVGLG